jgi:hypothetical protein
VSRPVVVAGVEQCDAGVEVGVNGCVLPRSSLDARSFGSSWQEGTRVMLIRFQVQEVTPVW